jgi:protein KRI1
MCSESMEATKLTDYKKVGDLPTRFKYVPVRPHGYSLTPVEILMATDQELNEYMSVKKYAPYRKDVKWDSKRVDRLKEFKSKISERIPISGEGNNTVDKPTKKRKGKKERSKLKVAEANEDRIAETKALSPPPATSGVIDTLKRKRGYEHGDDLAGSRQERENYGKKKRRRRKKEPQAGEL